jgi:deoxyadenosine/deoxycytidine kinase
MSLQHHFVIVSGNIGVGKSTLTHQLAQRLDWHPFLEAVEANPYLADFYEDMKRWSFHSQIFFLSRRLQHHHALLQYPGDVVQDRSVYEDAEIFARNAYLQGNMSERDYQCYRDLYEGIRAFLPAPGLVVYLKAPVSLLVERIAIRGRDYERQITADYLAQLNDLYEEWAMMWKASPMLCIEAQQYDFVQNTQDLEAITAQIQAALLPVSR